MSGFGWVCIWTSKSTCRAFLSWYPFSFVCLTQCHLEKYLDDFCVRSCICAHVENSNHDIDANEIQTMSCLYYVRPVAILSHLCFSEVLSQLTFKRREKKMNILAIGDTLLDVFLESSTTAGCYFPDSFLEYHLNIRFSFSLFVLPLIFLIVSTLEKQPV